MGLFRRIIYVSLCLCIGTGCSSLLPSSDEKVKSPWRDFDSAKENFEKITPYETRIDELDQYGFSPFNRDNVNVLTYLDVLQRFTIGQSISDADLPQGIAECKQVKELCRGYEFTISRVKKKRYGNFFADLLNFKRKTHIKGWEFSALIITRDDLVIYKLWKGTPSINQTKEKSNPLGPLQGSDRVIPRVIN